MPRTISDFFRRSSPILKLSALSAVLVFLMVLGYHSIGTSVRPAARAGSSPPTALAGCSRVDDSFCQTERDFKQYVAARSASDLFEHQQPVTITCDGSPPVQSYCGTAVTGAHVRLSSVLQDGKRQLLARNAYIGRMRAYFDQFGPFSYASTESDNGGMAMAFTGRTAGGLLLTFQRQGGGWQFVAPVIGGN